MEQPQFASPLIDQTVTAFNGNATAVSPMDGISLIINWVSVLDTDTETLHPLADSLNELKLQLQSGTPDGDQIRAILQDLTRQTHQAAESVEEADRQQSLHELASAIDIFSKQLAGERGPAQTGGNATSGPTVGGISSNSASPTPAD